MPQDKGKVETFLNGLFGSVNMPEPHKTYWANLLSRPLLWLVVIVIILSYVLNVFPKLRQYIPGSQDGASVTVSSTTELNVGINNGIAQTGANSTAIQNVNAVSKYTWDNQDTWEATSTLCSETDCKYTVRLFFSSNGPVVPVKSCLKIYSDARIVSVSAGIWEPDSNVTKYLAKNHLNSLTTCINYEIGTSPVFDIDFSNKPTMVQASLFDMKDLNQ